MKVKLLLFAIVLFGLFLRIVDINNNPRALYGDELTILFDANSILKTGHDQAGEFMPLTFSAGDTRPGGYVYSTVPFVALLGETIIAVRILSILSGVGIIFLMYLLGKRLFSEKLGLILAVLAAILPWDISLSRGGFEAHYALFLSLLGIYALLRVRENSKWWAVTIITFGITLLTYPTYRVTLPLFLIFIFLIDRYNKILKFKLKNLGTILFIIFFGIALLISFLQVVDEGPSDRFSNINLLAQDTLKQQVIQTIDTDRSFDTLPKQFVGLFHNKALEYGGIFMEDYFRNLFPNFLFLHGDSNPRHNPATMGEFYFAELALIVVGLVFLWVENRNYFILFAGWILLAPIATAMVGEPQALRDTFLLPPLLFVSGIGLYRLLILSRRNLLSRISLVIIGLVFIVQFPVFIDRLYFVSPNAFGRFWSYPAKQASELAIQNKNDYKYIIVNQQIDSMEFAYPVYAQVDPNLFVSQNTQKTKLNGFDFRQYGNVYVGSIPPQESRTFIESLNGSVLYIGTINDKPFLKNLEILSGTDGLPSLVIEKLK